MVSGHKKKVSGYNSPVITMPDNPNDPKIPCPLCKAPVPEGNKFCEVCGATMPVQRACPKCGAPAASAILKFCEECGAPFNQVKEPPQATRVLVPLLIQPSDSSVSAEPAPVVEPKPISPVKPSTPGTGVSGKKKSIIGAVAGIVLLIVIALVALPALNLFPATPGLSASVPAPIPSPVVISPSATMTSPVASLTMVPSATGTGADTLIPGPTQRMPEATNVLITADKDTITGAVSVQITGGPGRSVIKEVSGTVYRSDGQTSTGTINPALRSQEVVIPGSKGTDRVVVTVLLFSGEQYVVMDKLMTFRAHG